MIMIALGKIGTAIWNFLERAGKARYEKYQKNPQAYWY